MNEEEFEVTKSLEISSIECHRDHFNKRELKKIRISILKIENSAVRLKKFKQ